MTTEQNNIENEKSKPLTLEECQHFIHLMNTPDENCHILKEYGDKLLDQPIHIIYVESHYHVIGVDNQLYKLRSMWWDLGESLNMAKHKLYETYLVRYMLWNKIDLSPFQNLLSELYVTFHQWEDVVWKLATKLKLHKDDVIDFVTEIEHDCLSEGCLNCDTIIDSYWMQSRQKMLRKYDPNRSVESIHEEFDRKFKLRRKPKDDTQLDAESKPVVNSEEPMQNWEMAILRSNLKVMQSNMYDLEDLKNTMNKII
jgi:hypothetical protein